MASSQSPRGPWRKLAGTGQTCSCFRAFAWAVSSACLALSKDTQKGRQDSWQLSRCPRVFLCQMPESLTSVFYKPTSIKPRLPITSFLKRAVLWGGACRFPQFGNDPTGKATFPSPGCAWGEEGPAGSFRICVSGALVSPANACGATLFGSCSLCPGEGDAHMKGIL